MSVRIVCVFLHREHIIMTSSPFALSPVFARRVQPGKPEVLYVANIPKSATDEEIKAWLASRAPAVAISVATSRAFFYVAYASAAEAAAAITKLNGADFSGRTLEAEQSRFPKTPEEIAARNAQRDAERADRKAARAAAAPKPAAAAAGGAAAAVPAERKFYDRRVEVRSGNNTRLDAVALEKIFSTCGPVTRVRVADSKDEAKSGRLARLTFETADAARNAITLNDTDLAGNFFKVVFETMRKKRTSRGKKAAAAGGAGESAPKTAPAPKKAREPRAVSTTSAGAPKRRVRVDFVSGAVTQEDLQAAFESAGAIINAKVVKAGTHGFVTFEAAAAVAKALTMTAVKDASVKVTLDEAARTPRTRTTIDVANTLWVAGMESASEEQLRGLFASFGVESVKVVGRGKAAYVRLTSEGGVAGAVAAGASLEGKALIVEKATGPLKPKRSSRRRPEGEATA